MEKYSIDIVLSTFNPNIEFLKQQLDSIKNQSQAIPFCLNLLIRDDCSFNSHEILQMIQNYNFKHLHFIQGVKNLGFLKSYNYLLSLSKSDLVFICDQDDIWHSNKVYSFILTYLKNQGNDQPIVLASDSICIDSLNNTINQSSLDLFGYNKNKSNAQFFLKNYVPGCTLAANRIAIQSYLNTKNFIGLHDHLLILCAIVYGKLIISNESLTYYRLHNSNTLGINKRSLYYRVRDLYYSIKFMFRKDAYHIKSFLQQKEQIFWLYNRPCSELKSILFFENFKKYFVQKDKSINGRSFFSGRDFGESIVEWVLFR